MKFKTMTFFFYFFINIFSISFEEIINNPIKIDKEFNPVDYIIIYQSETAVIQTSTGTKTLNLKKNLEKFPHDSYLLSQPLFIFINEGNTYNIFLGNRFFQFSFTTSPEKDIKTNSIMNEESLP